jgi:hypothetical protein
VSRSVESHRENEEASALKARQQDTASNNDSPPDALAVQMGRWKCSRGTGFCLEHVLGFHDRVYTCMNCIDVEFCEKCYATLIAVGIATEGTRKLHILQSESSVSQHTDRRL